MVPSLVINEEVGIQYCEICGVGSSETTEVDNINLFLANLLMISTSSFVSPRHSQNSFDPPMRLALVALSLCPFAFARKIFGQMITPAVCPAIQVNFSTNETCIVRCFVDA